MDIAANAISETNSPNVRTALALCEGLARERFDIPSLRAAQRQVLEAVLSRPGGVLATLPTGSGKTLLYTLPALLWNQPVLVVCPLISLMRDQARRMEAASVPTAVFTSEQSEEERRAHLQLLCSGQARLVFASPERLVMPSFIRMLAQRRIAMAVIDEAHCVAAWGPSFRPEYAEIGRILAELAPQRILALTATASRPARRIICEKVFPEGWPVKEVLFHPLRPNVHVATERLPTEDEKWRSLVETLKATASQKSIVYFPRRDLCTQAALSLRRCGLHAVAYHAGLTREERQSVESYVHSATGKLVVCATQAFGMGVDVSGVGLVVVYGFPGGIEDFFQMIGRAGRGGEPAEGMLLWTGADPKKRQFQFDISYPTGEELERYLDALITVFPETSCKRLISESTLPPHLGLSADKARKVSPGIMTALRLLGALELPFANEPYVSLSLAKKQTLLQLLDALPPGPTRRAHLLGFLRDTMGAQWSRRAGAMTALPARILCDATRLTWEQCAEIFYHYAAHENLSWEFLTAEQMRDRFILVRDWNETRAVLPKYLRLRSEFQQSLRELEKLAKSSSCRLAESHTFFGSSSQAGSKRPCGQCDLCRESLQSS